MAHGIEAIGSLDDLREYIHAELCQKENLLAEQFLMSEQPLARRGRGCGIQFTLQGPRSVRLGAIWASDHNAVYFYDAGGERYRKVRLTRRLLRDEELAAA